MKRAIAAAFIAGLSAGCGLIKTSEPIETEKITYQGNLPSYGPAELVVYTRKGTDEVTCAELRTTERVKDYNFEYIRMCDLEPRDGKRELNYGLIFLPGGGTGQHISPGYRDFAPADQAMRFALAARGNHLKKVGE